MASPNNNKYMRVTTAHGCGFKKGPVRPLFQSKSRRWRGSDRASPSHPPGGNHEYRTAETRTQADMGIKARAP